MDFTTTLLAVIVGLILLFTAVLAVRHRILFTMGVRNFSRRPKNTAVVIVGLLISTAVISGSLVAGDSFNYTIQKIAYDSLGAVDEVVTVGSQYGNYQFFNSSVYNKLAADPTVTGLVAGIAPEVSINVPSVLDASNGVTATGARLFGTNLTIDKSFGSFTLLDGTRTDATDLRADEVLIQNKLARELNAHVGDTLTVYGASTGAALSARNFTINYIAQDEGKAQYGTGNLNIYTTLDAAQAFAQMPGQITGIRITNTGNAENGAAASPAVVDAVTHALAGLPLSFTVSPIKQNLLIQAQNTGALISSLFVLLSAFSVAAGVALIINIFVMLAEERKGELGIVRAIGLPRGHLMELVLFEGVIYAVIAAALGSVAGIGVGAALMYGFNWIFVNIGASLSVHYSASMVLEAFLIGMIVTLATIGLTSFRISRINIIQAIRNTEEEGDTGRSNRVVAASALLVALGVALYVVAGSNVLIKVIAPPLAILGAGVVGSRFTSSRWTFSVAGIALVAYILYLFNTLTDLSSTDANTLFVAGGILLVIGVVLIAVVNVTTLIRALNGAFGRTRALGAIIKPSLAYPFNKMFRTGLTVTMFSLVTFIIVFFAISSATYQVDVAKQAGGYDVRATSAVPLSNLTNAPQAAPAGGAVTAQTSGAVSPSVVPFDTSKITYSDGLFTTSVYGLTINNQTVQYRGPPFDTVYGIDASFVGHATYGFQNTAANTTSQAVWQSLASPQNVILDAGYIYGGGSTPVKAGDTVRLTTANGTSAFTVTGVLDESYLHGVFMDKSAMRQVFPTIMGNNLFLIKTAPGVDPLNVTYDLKRDFQQYGVDAGVIRDEVLQLNQQNNLVNGVIQVFLGLGLIIGVASLGIIAVRSVLERRRDIGIMLAMGLEKRKVFLSMLIEVLFITTLGSLIGLITGVASSYANYLSISQPTNPFTIPVTLLVAIYVIIYIAAIVCTLGPARAAAALPPADAVRYSE